MEKEYCRNCILLKKTRKETMCPYVKLLCGCICWKGSTEYHDLFPVFRRENDDVLRKVLQYKVAKQRKWRHWNKEKMEKVSGERNWENQFKETRCLWPSKMARRQPPSFRRLLWIKNGIIISQRQDCQLIDVSLHFEITNFHMIPTWLESSLN